MYLTNPTRTEQGRICIDYFAEQGVTKVAAIGQDNELGVEAFDAIDTQAPVHGMEIVAKEEVEVLSDAVAPAVLLWQRPADLWSLLLVQTPLRARSELQLRLSALQSAPVLRVALMGTAGLLPLLWWLDSLAPMASRFSPLLGAPRLSSLLLSAALLALMLWQWLQLWQALWVLSRPPETISQATPLSQGDLEGSRLCLGLPLLLEPLAMEVPAGDGSPATTAPVVPDSAAVPDSVAIAVEPEQAAEQSEGSQLDQQVD